MRRMGDRRSSVRHEVVGALWGTLETRKRAQVMDLGEGGALLVYPVPVLPDTTHTVEMYHEGHRISVEVRVRHVRRVTVGAEPAQYFAGVEFLSRPEPFPDPS